MSRTPLYYLSPILKIGLFIFFIILWVVPVIVVLNFNFLPFDKDSFALDFFAESGLVIAVIGALLMVFGVFYQIDWWTIFVRKLGALSGFLKGSLIGLLLVAVCGGILWANGNVSFTEGYINPALLLGYLAYFILVALFEELMFRTYALFVLAERYPMTVAILINSIGFGLVHLANPGYTPLAFLNIVLAGVLFSVFTLLKQNVSWAIGIHFGWNFAQGILLGYKVSGIDTPRALIAKPIGEAYLSGGTFGIEGSIFCTLVLGILVLWLLYRYRFAPVELPLEITSEEKEQIE